MPDQSEAPIVRLERRLMAYERHGPKTEVVVNLDDLRAFAEIIRLCKEALQECADDLKQEVRERWCMEPDGTCHPALQPKLDRDMAPVNKAYAVLAQIKGQNP